MAKCERCGKNHGNSNSISKNLWRICGIIFVMFAIIGGILFLFVGCESNEETSLPPYEERIETYEVVTVYKYVRNVTNNYGGVRRTEICYSFSYLDGDTLKHEENFRHEALRKVTIGEQDLYIVDPYTDEEYLQLTKETFKLLTGSSD